MPTDKRQRHKEGREARRQQAVAEARRRQRRKRITQIVGITVVVLVLALLVSTFAGEDDDATDVASEGSTTSTTAAAAADPIECATSDAGEVDTSTKPEITIPDGEPPTELECTDLVVGDGDEVALGDTIEVHYVGVKHSDGSQFDASWDGGEPVEFSLAAGSLIEGWTDAIPGMKVGGRRELVIPPDKAYGPAGSGHELAGETLVFVVDVISVAKP